jgi:polyhydroxybutyrate depolymerase
MRLRGCQTIAFRRVLVLLALLDYPPAWAGEADLIIEALAGHLDHTAAFDVNADGRVNVADLAARVRVGEPRSRGCGGLLPPDGSQTIRVGSDTRRYVVRLPSNYDNRQPAPVIFGFHGFTGTARTAEGVAQLAQWWPDAIGVYGEGLLRTFSIFPGVVGQGWQVFPGESGDRDVAFFDAMLAHMTDQYCIDPERVYATGHSNGAFFSNLLACMRGDQIAAIGPMAGGLFGCPGDAQVAAIVSHGTEDQIVGFTLGAATRDFWIRRNGCSDDLLPYTGGCEISPECPDDRRVGFCPFSGTHAPDEDFPLSMYRFFREQSL